MKEIPLTQGKVALVDDADYAWLSQWKWYGVNVGQNLYAVGRMGKRTLTYMHTAIMGKRAGFQIDHINRDGLDNRRENLRFATQSQNARNQAARRTNPTGLKGVTEVTRGGRWMARIGTGTTQLFLGTFETPDAAARAYDEAARKYHGDFARLNFPQES